MTTTETRAAAKLGPERLAALRPHVVNLQDGRLAARAARAPRKVDEYRSTEADVRAIFRTHLPAFIEEHRPGPVPVVLWAHGGLVDKESGFAIAAQQTDWWKRNGVYPIHFVWETGIWSAVGDSLSRWASGGRRGWLDDARDNFIEVAARLLGGPGIWNDMKLDAAAASAGDGGALVLAGELARFVEANPTAISVHAVGHSAGSIFHSHFLPVALDAGVPRFETVSFLAPAVRIDTFTEKVLARAKDGAIERLAVFDMDDETEQDDTCVGLYGKSLLYLVSRSFESAKDTPLLGLEKDIARNRAVASFVTRPPAADGELILAPRDRGPRTGSGSRTHGGFDNDIPTMDSVLRRVSGRSEIVSFATVGGAREIALPEPVVDDPGSTSRAGRSTRRALCIGIDEYPTPRDRLRGCVADATMWHEAFEARGFEVTTLTDAQATRTGILTAMLDLVSEAAPGDVLAIQYSGHGTTAPDLDGDEQPGGDETEDEALCPVDFRDGELILDDDLARIWEVIPSGVGVTLFFDCCHSGAANRAPAEDLPEDALPRWVDLDDDAIAAFRRRRGAAAASPEREEALLEVRAAERPGRADRRPPRTGREFLFSACRSTEVAWESDGHGDFTRIAAPLVAAASSDALRNRDFHRAVLEAFGDRRRQTPEMHGSDVLAGRLLLGPARRRKEAEPEPPEAEPSGAEPSAPAGPGPETDAAGPAGIRPAASQGAADRRTAAVAALLRAVADVLEA